MDTIFTILYGIFTLGILIFVHELGHFVAGKLTGIRVVGFSIGFGRGIISFDRKGTHYKIGWLPVGGYCRFAGEGEDLSDDRKGEPDEFYERPAWARLITVSAGVFFNFLFGIFIYWVLAVSGGSYVSASPKLHIINKKMLEYYGPRHLKFRPFLPALAAGMQHGDRVLSINGKTIKSYRQLLLEVASSGKETLHLKILRDGKVIDKKVITAISRRSAGYLNVGAWAPPAVAAVSPGSVALKSGLQSGDYIFQVNGETVANSHEDLLRILRGVAARTNAERKVRIRYSRYDLKPVTLRVPSFVFRHCRFAADNMPAQRERFRVYSPAPLKGLNNGDYILSMNGKGVFDFSSFRKQVARIKKDPVVLNVISGNEAGIFPRVVSRKSIRAVAAGKAAVSGISIYNPPALSVSGKGSPLFKSGFRDGDIIRSVNGSPVVSVRSLRNLIRRSAGKKVAVSILRRRRGALVAVLKKGVSAFGIAVATPVRYVFVNPPMGIFSAVGSAVGEFVSSFSRIVKGLSKLFYKETEIQESAGGPLRIVGLSGKILKDGSFRNWLELLALLSIAIGFMNLLPIPALDGGHIILNIIELIRRKRMSFKVLHRIQLVGVSILFTLFFFIILLDVLKLDKIF